MAKPSKAMIWSLGHSLSHADLSTKGKINWPILLSECDEQGRFLADAKDYKRSICPIIDEIEMDDVPDLLTELEAQRMVILYTADSRALGQIVKWWEWQKPTWARRSRYPPPPGWKDRVREKGADGITDEAEWKHPGGLNVPIEQYSLEQNSIDQYRDTTTTASASDDHDMTNAYSSIFTEVTGVLIATAVQAEEIDAWMEDIPEDWFRDACKEAVDNNAWKWSYIRAILKRWKKEGKKKKRAKDKRRGKRTGPTPTFDYDKALKREAAEKKLDA